MIDELAKLLCEQYGDDWAIGKELHRANARAVLARLREPTEKMIEAGDNADKSTIAKVEIIFRAMIDAA